MRQIKFSEDGKWYLNFDTTVDKEIIDNILEAVNRGDTAIVIPDATDAKGRKLVWLEALVTETKEIAISDKIKMIVTNNDNMYQLYNEDSDEYMVISKKDIKKILAVVNILEDNKKRLEECILITEISHEDLK